MRVSTDFLEAKREIRRTFLHQSVMAASAAAGNAVGVGRDARLRAETTVHAVGVGRRMVNGKRTGEMAVQLFVRRKLPKNAVPATMRIPEEIDGIPTDIIQSPRAYFANTTADPSIEVGGRSRHRPIPGGVSIGHLDITAGTVSCFCRSTRADDPERVCLLSNNHILANTNRGRPGDRLRQPGPRDGGTETDDVAELHRYVRLSLGGAVANRVDAAIGRLLDAVEHDARVLSIGQVTGMRRAVEEMEVRKHGRTTGHTRGIVTTESYDALIGVDHGDPTVVALFEDQFRISRRDPFAAFGLGGDSGSLVVDATESAAVGLFFACAPDGSYGIANHIEDVVRELEIELI